MENTCIFDQGSFSSGFISHSRDLFRVFQLLSCDLQLPTALSQPHQTRKTSAAHRRATGLLIMRTTAGFTAFKQTGDMVSNFLAFADKGSEFVPWPG